MQAGLKYNITPGSPNQPRRLEGGMLSFRNDISTDMNALEVGLPDKFVNLKMDHDFIGKDALLQLRANGGPTRKIVGFSIEGQRCEEPMLDKWKLRAANGELVGDTGSIAFSYNLGKMIGIATVGIEHAAAGSQLELVTSNGTVLPATTCKLPFE